jgi:hypothetical protein
MSGQFRRSPRVDPANARTHAPCPSFHHRGEMPFAGKRRRLLWDPPGDPSRLSGLPYGVATASDA